LSGSSWPRDRFCWRFQHAAAGASLCLALACGCDPVAPSVTQSDPAPAAPPSVPTDVKPTGQVLTQTEAKAQEPSAHDPAKDSPPTAASQDKPSGAADKADSLVTPRVTIDPPTVRPGETFVIRVEAQIESGWHIYAVDRPTGPSIPTSIDFKLPKTLAWEGDWAVSEPSVDDAHPDEPAFIYQGSASFSRRVRVARDAPSGAVNLRGKLGYQACDKFSCRAPTHSALEADVKIAP
jgi:Disulphide bond corrector protein DsbC